MSNVRGVARIWCEEGHESKKNNVRVTPKYYEIDAVKNRLLFYWTGIT